MGSGRGRYVCMYVCMKTTQIPYVQETKRITNIELTSSPDAVIRITKNTEIKPVPTTSTLITLNCTQHRITERNTVSINLNLTDLEGFFEAV